MTTAAIRTTPLMTKLNNEWAARHAHHERDFGTLGIRTGGDLLADIRSTTRPAQDALLYELVSMAHSGHREAERVLVQALVPAAQRMAHRVRALDDFDRADRVGFAIGAAWEAIRSYRLHLHERVMANLTMNMLGLLAPEKSANDRLIADKTTPVSDDFLEEASGSWEAEDPTPEVRLAALFTWAIDTGVLTRDEVALLSRAALGDEKHAEIAADLDITVAGLRKRLDRIRWRLSDAARDQL